MNNFSPEAFEHLYGEFAVYSIDQLNRAKLDSPEDADWLDPIIQAKKQALRLDDMGTRLARSARQTRLSPITGRLTPPELG